MRNLLLIILVVILSSCNDEAAFDCVKTTGEITTYDILVPEFNEIDIFNNTTVTIEQGAEQKITLITGANLKDKIHFNVTDGILSIEDQNTCTWARDYGNVKVKITTPNLTQIRSSGGGQIKSSGTLQFSDLTLISEERTADFTLLIDCETLRVVNNNLSNYYISGVANTLFTHFFAGDGRFEGAGLVANYVDVYHEGTNDIIINPQLSLTGEIQQTGHVIFCKKPPVMTIKLLDDRGKLIEGC